MSARTDSFLPPLPEDWMALKGVVERFDRAWREGSRPGIEEYLPREGPLRVQALIELVHIDLERRVNRGEQPRIEEYLAGYPELASNRPVVLELIVREHELRRRRHL